MNCIRLLNSRCMIRQFMFKTISPKYSTHPLKFLEVQERWRQRDGVSKRWELIYKAPMDSVINWTTTYITVTTSLFTCAGLYYATALYGNIDPNQPVVLGSSSVVVADNVYECLIYIGAFILFHIAVKVFLSKYVLRLYKSGDNYVAIFRGHMYNSIKKHEFSLQDFERLKPTFVVSWGDARFSLAGKHGIILEDYFKTPEYFNKLLTKKDDDSNEE